MHKAKSTPSPSVFVTTVFFPDAWSHSGTVPRTDHRCCVLTRCLSSGDRVPMSFVTYGSLGGVSGSHPAWAPHHYCKRCHHWSRAPVKWASVTKRRQRPCQTFLQTGRVTGSCRYSESMENAARFRIVFLVWLLWSCVGRCILGVSRSLTEWTWHHQKKTNGGHSLDWDQFMAPSSETTWQTQATCCRSSEGNSSHEIHK